MRRLRSLLLSAAVLVAPGLAAAADMGALRAPVVIGEHGPVEEEIGTGWYLRGDLGYSQAQSPSINLGATSFTGMRNRGEEVYGGGFGYKFTDWMRADLTIDQLTTYGMKTRVGSVGCYGGDICRVDRGIDGKVIPILANAYADFGNWAGFTPYVGVGAGVARVRTSGTLTYTGAFGGMQTTTADSGSKWTPAFAGMAGLAIDLGAGIQLDAGYRYLWLAQDSTGTLTQVGNGGMVPRTVELKNSGFHQARLGLRYVVN